MQIHPPESSSFSELASAFCGWCESDSFPERPENAAAVWLARLHAAALVLPVVSCDDDDRLPELPQSLLDRVAGNLSYFSGMYYRKVFDPSPLLTEMPVLGDIGDDILDTYKDIREGVVLVAAGRPQEALWHWRFLHSVHWGRHAVSALAALHAISQEVAA